MMQTCTIEQIKSINVSLADRLCILANSLQNEIQGSKSSYLVCIEITDNDTMMLYVDNGFDVSKSISVSNMDKEKILQLF